MKRRDFLKIFGGAAAAPAGLALGGASSQATEPAASKPFDLEEITISEIQAGLDSGRFTAVSLVERYLSRIESIDRSGPTLKAVIELNPDALDIARQLDEERKANGARGPLHGVPILIKDNLDTHDRMRTSAGSLALAESFASKDSFVVHRLRQAGAVILGKTNLSEWANFRSSRSTSGWSGRGGQTRNPYVLDRNPSGSSSGSGAAVSANLCAAAIGTETDGSIVSPSSFCGIVGLKPTVGLVSRSGIIPISHSQDTAGPMARTVSDAAILLGAIAGSDPADPATASAEAKLSRDYTRFLDPDGLRGARIGVVRKLFRGHPAAMRVIEEALEPMRRLGAVLVDPADLPSHGKIGRAEFDVLLYEFKAGLNKYLAGVARDLPVHSLEELIEFNRKEKDRELIYFGQETLELAQEKGSLEEQEYREALEKCRRFSRDEGIDAAMNEHRLDALVAPTTGPAHVTDFVYGDRDTGGSSSPAAVAGYPSITVPAGWVSELPVGISFFGRAYSEPILLKLAFAFEQAASMRKPPRFLKTIG